MGSLSTIHLQKTGDLPPASHQALVNSTPVYPCPNANQDSSFSNTADSPSSLDNLRPHKDPSLPLNPITKELSPSHYPTPNQDSQSPKELSPSHHSVQTPHSHTELDTSPLNTETDKVPNICKNFPLPLETQEAEAAEGSDMALPTIHATQPSPCR